MLCLETVKQAPNVLWLFIAHTGIVAEEFIALS